MIKTEKSKQFDRYSFRNNILRRVLIRIDYEGVTNFDRWMDEFVGSLELTKHFNKISRGVVSKQNPNILGVNDDIQKLPVQNGEVIFKCYDSNFEGRNDVVSATITPRSFIFNIECQNYQTIDPYIDYVSEYLKLFLDGPSHKYHIITRIGIRKLGGDVFESIKHLTDTFENHLFPNTIKELEDSTIIEKQYIDKFYDRVKVNYARMCRITNDIPYKFQAILDLDGYVDRSIIGAERISSDKAKQYMEQINSYLYDLFLISVTTSYLQSQCQETK